MMLHVSLVTACIILDSVFHLGIPRIREVDATWTLQPTHPKALAIISPLTKHSLQHTKWCPFFGGGGWMKMNFGTLNHSL